MDPVSGALFISDTNSRRIYRVRSLTGGRLLSDNAEVVAGTGEQCLPFDERCGDGGKATEATLMSPKGKPRENAGEIKLVLKTHFEKNILVSYQRDKSVFSAFLFENVKVRCFYYFFIVIKQDI